MPKINEVTQVLESLGFFSHYPNGVIYDIGDSFFVIATDNDLGDPTDEDTWLGVYETGSGDPVENFTHLSVGEVEDTFKKITQKYVEV